jgi:hypothetical protein
MADNKYRGVPIEIGGRPLFLRYDFNALVAVEESNGSLEVKFQSPKAARALIWAGLQHMKEAPTLVEVGDMLSEYQHDMKRYGEILEAAAKAYAQAFPEAPKEPTEDDSKNAPATPGTGV